MWKWRGRKLGHKDQTHIYSPGLAIISQSREQVLNPSTPGCILAIRLYPSAQAQPRDFLLGNLLWPLSLADSEGLDQMTPELFTDLNHSALPKLFYFPLPVRYPTWIKIPVS